MVNSRLEEYVQSATARLPESERALEQQEIRQHLTALIAAREELGDTQETATNSALEQLGDAHQIRQQLLKTHRRAKFYGLMNRPLPKLWTAYHRRRLAAFLQTWPGAIVGTMLALYWVYTFVPMVLALLYNPFVLLWSGCGMWLLQCCLFGWLSCRLSGRRCLPVLAVVSIWFNLRYVAPQIVRGPVAYEEWRILLFLTASTLVLPLLSAYISLRLSPSFRKA